MLTGRKGINACFCVVSVSHAEMPLATFKQPLASITHVNTFQHYRVHFYTFGGQPFLKQLFVG